MKFNFCQFSNRPTNCSASIRINCTILRNLHAMVACENGLPSPVQFSIFRLQQATPKY